MTKLENFINQIKEVKKIYGKPNHIYIKFSTSPLWKKQLREEEKEEIQRFLLCYKGKNIIIRENDFLESINNIDDLKAFEGYKLLI